MSDKEYSMRLESPTAVTAGRSLQDSIFFSLRAIGSSGNIQQREKSSRSFDFFTDPEFLYE